MNRKITIVIIGAVLLNFILPFTFSNGDLVTKRIFSIGNPVLILFYIFLLLILLSTVSQKDINNEGKVILDKPKDIPKTIIRSVLEMIFGIIFIFFVPLIGGAFLFWSGVSIELVAVICISYIAFIVYLCKKYYWKNLYK
jgi:hypothetical protein